MSFNVNFVERLQGQQKIRFAGPAVVHHDDQRCRRRQDRDRGLSRPAATHVVRPPRTPMADHDDHCWFPVAVRENEEVVPVNVSTGVDDLPPAVARLVLPLVETAVPE